MAIFTDFAYFCIPPLKELYLENEDRSLHQTWSVCYWRPMSMFGWVLNKSKIWLKMDFAQPRYGDFHRFCLILTPPIYSCLSRTKKDLFTKLGQCATEVPCQCLVQIQTNPKIDWKWWFFPTRAMAIFTKFALGPYRAVSSAGREITSPNLVSVLLKSHVNVWLSFKENQNLTQNGDFSPPAVWRFLPNLHSALIGPFLQNEERSLRQIWSV